MQQVDGMTSQGQTVADAVRSIGVTEVTYYLWQQEHGGLKSDQIRRMKEPEHQRPRKAVGDLTLDKLILAEAAWGKLLSPPRQRACVEHFELTLSISERRACAAWPATPARSAPPARLMVAPRPKPN